MAMNIWKSRGATQRQQTLGLGNVSIELPTSDDLTEVSQRLKQQGLQLVDDGAVIKLDDPWGNQVTLSTSAVTA
jgi:catechol 2,3-dioxygenase